jgi:hypothetical protein
MARINIVNDETMQRLRDDLDAMSFKYFPGSRKGRQSSARFHLPELVKYVASEIDKTEKAYGGCHLCFGKGFSTYRHGETYRGKTTNMHTDMKFCICDRGKALAAEIERAEVAAQIDDKPSSSYQHETEAPPANQGDDELEQILKDLQTSWMYESPKPDFEATALRLREAAKSSIVALHHRQLAERLQQLQVRLKPKPIREVGGVLSVSGWDSGYNTAIFEIQNIITELMPPQSFDPTEISLCDNCGCMIHTLTDGRCGKCKAPKELMPKEA